MMMEALIAGGMDAAWSEQRDLIPGLYADALYSPNKSGLFEIPLSEYTMQGFPLQYTGKLIKVLVWGLSGLAEHEYSVVFMLRDYEEIRQSYQAFLGNKLRVKKNQFEENIAKALEGLRSRKSVSLTVLNYRDVVNDPVEQFSKLTVAGWDFDVNAAASVVSKSLCRFRTENLIAGL